ncbi:MAG: cysteine desulfurase family protein [Candidatus Xenobia bacterium]
MKLPIYMDHHATTPLDPRVLEAMLPYFTEHFGNAASSHAFGEAAEAAVDTARREIASLIGSRDARAIVFTSGATESDNLALRGVMEPGQHLITTAIEHKAVLDTAKALGCELTVLPVDSHGLVDPADVEKAITERTRLVSVILANNEIGVIQPLQEIGRIARNRGVLLHSDATQAVGHVPVDVETLGLDLMSLSAHKMYGPKGVGSLWVRRRPRVRLVAQIAGGGHERGMRSGTLNVPGIVGFGTAAAIASKEMAVQGTRLAALRQRLWDGLAARIDRLALNGHPERRLPGNLNVRIRHVEGESLLLRLQAHVALSTGSACTSATLEPSHVLRAIGLSDDEANGSIRFGLGRFNTEAEIDYVVERVAEAVARLRELSPLS